MEKWIGVGSFFSPLRILYRLHRVPGCEDECMFNFTLSGLNAVCCRKDPSTQNCTARPRTTCPKEGFSRDFNKACEQECGCVDESGVAKRYCDMCCSSRNGTCTAEPPVEAGIVLCVQSEPRIFLLGTPPSPSLSKQTDFSSSKEKQK